MKFIPPLEITSKIMSLIEEAQKEIIIVSPYVNIQKWGKMKSCIERAIDRGVAITIIARRNAEQDLSYFNYLKVKLVLVMDLHAKLYINDDYAIVTSQNLLQYSDNNSIEIGYVTTSNLEREELVNFVNQFIVNLIATNYNNPISVSSARQIDSLNLVEPNESLNLVGISDEELKNLSSTFINKYKDCKFVSTKDYIFCGHLIHSADVMINSSYTLKFRKSDKDCNRLIEEISKIKFEFLNSISIELKSNHEKFHYLTFVPIAEINYLNLIKDYIGLTDAILNNPILIEIEQLKLIIPFGRVRNK